LGSECPAEVAKELGPPDVSTDEGRVLLMAEIAQDEQAKADAAEAEGEE
jgi:hypothetical protein